MVGVITKWFLPTQIHVNVNVNVAIFGPCSLLEFTLAGPRKTFQSTECEFPRLSKIHINFVKIK